MKKQKNWQKIEKVSAALTSIGTVLLMPLRVMANGTGLTILDNMQKLVLDVLTGIGICFLAFGVITLSISLQSHDDSQRSRAIMSMIGGAIAISVRTVLDLLGVAHQ